MGRRRMRRMRRRRGGVRLCRSKSKKERKKKIQFAVSSMPYSIFICINSRAPSTFLHQLTTRVNPHLPSPALAFSFITVKGKLQLPRRKGKERKGKDSKRRREREEIRGHSYLRVHPTSHYRSSIITRIKINTRASY